MSGLARALGLARSLVVYWGQPWKRASMDRMYAHYVQPGDLCFDVGSHAGNRVRSFLALGARVVAIEPQPDFVALLRRLYGADPRVVLEPVGLADRPGRLTLHVSARHPTVSTFDRSWIDEVTRTEKWGGVAWDGAVEVEVKTLDQLIAAHGEPAFVKIDVEGFEEAVIRGASRPLAALSFEYVPAAIGRALAIVDHLEGLGRYAWRTSPGETHAFAQDQEWDAEPLRAFLRGLGPDDASGDVYARLRTAR